MVIRPPGFLLGIFCTTLASCTPRPTKVSRTAAYYSILLVVWYSPRLFYTDSLPQHIFPLSILMKVSMYERLTIKKWLQLNRQSVRLTRKINLASNQKGYDNSETTIGILSARRIQIWVVYFCLDNILKVILNNFQNKAQTKIDRSEDVRKSATPPPQPWSLFLVLTPRH